MSKKDKATTNTAKNNDTNTVNQPVIIFHRSQKNARKAQITQEIFMLDYNRNYPHSESAEVIDYVTGDNELAREINEIILDGTQKPVVIVNNAIPAMEYEKEYDMYSRFCYWSRRGKIELYIMDSMGGLYRKVEELERNN